MPDDLYDRDILTWSEEQAAILRRLAGGDPVREAVDWPHLIEEVEDLGRAELHACESLLRQAMLHLLKLRNGADLPAAHWRTETLGFLADAAARFTPAMRQRIDMDRLYLRAVRQMRAAALPGAMLACCDTCPWRLEDLLSDASDIDELVAARCHNCGACLSVGRDA